METKYISCNSAISTDVWVKRFIVNLQLVLSEKKRKNLLICFAITSLPSFQLKSGAESSKAKHIDINYHYTQDIMERGEIKVDCVPSSKIVVDLMTKGLSLKKFRDHETTMDLRIIQMCSHNIQYKGIIEKFLGMLGKTINTTLSNSYIGQMKVKEY